MNRPELECLSAMIDGEPVDPAEVERALAAPGGVEALIGFLALRREIGAATEAERPDPATARRIARRLRIRSTRRWLPAAAAAAALVLALSAPLLLPRRPAEPAEGPPPPPDRVLRFEPGREWSG